MTENILEKKLHLKTDFSQTNAIDSAERQLSYLIVTRTGKHLKVSPTSYFLLQNFNNGLTPQEIADSLSQYQNSDISATTVLTAYEDLCEKIERLDSNENSKRKGFWFLLEIVSSRAVTRIAQPLSLLFHPIIAVLMIILIFITIIFDIQANIFSDSASAVQNPEDFWKGYLLFLLSVLFHEFGHASASLRYGATPSGIGFTIYLIFPALYSDVTTSWKLKSKQRAIVGLGGMYFQLIVAAYYTLLNSISASGSFRVAILLIFGSLLFNLNPFFKFDAYWILSDLLGVINLSQQPRRFLIFLYNRLRKLETVSLPWSNSVSACVGIYSILGILVMGIFISIYSSYFYAALQNYPNQIRHFCVELINNQAVSFSEAHALFLSSFTIFILVYFIYNIALKSLLKKIKVRAGASIIIICLCLVGAGFSQIKQDEIDSIRLATIIQNAQAKSRKNTTVFFEDYEHSFKRTIEFEGQNKRSAETYEQYCLNNNKSFCASVLIERNGVQLPPLKVQKAREKAAKELEKNALSTKNSYSGSGILLDPILIDSNAYLKYCKVSSSSQKTIDDRVTVVLYMNNCNLPSVYKKNISYLPKTEAEILIDELDESVVRMSVYANAEFSLGKNQNRPIITLENIRIPEGYWLFKAVRLEGIGNKTIFPEMRNNLQYDFFDFKKSSVTVTYTKAN